MLEERAKMQNSSKYHAYSGDTASRRKTTVLAGDVLDYVYSYYGTEILKGKERSGYSLLKNTTFLES